MTWLGTLLLGDIFEGHGTPDRELLPALRRLTAPLGAWAILGNHEFHGDPAVTAGFMREAGFEVLRNRWAEPRAGVDLMLSGHTHGGQLWPFGYLVRQVFPLYQGRHEVEGMPLIVSRGTGTWGPRMRLWRPAEILRITLRGKSGA